MFEGAGQDLLCEIHGHQSSLVVVVRLEAGHR
jgi:hypothetical protein